MDSNLDSNLDPQTSMKTFSKLLICLKSFKFVKFLGRGLTDLIRFVEGSKTPLKIELTVTD